MVCQNCLPKAALDEGLAKAEPMLLAEAGRGGPEGAAVTG